MNANDRKEYLEVSKCALDYKRFQKLKKKKFLKKIITVDKKLRETNLNLLESFLVHVADGIVFKLIPMRNFTIEVFSTELNLR